MYDHFADTDAELQQRGDLPLHDQLDRLLHEHETGTGTVERVLEAQDALKAALGRKNLRLLLTYENLLVSRLIDGERLGYNFGFAHGLVRGRAEHVDHEGARDLAVAIGDLIVLRDVEDRDVLRALAVVLVGLAGR